VVSQGPGGGVRDGVGREVGVAEGSSVGVTVGGSVGVAVGGRLVGGGSVGRSVGVGEGVSMVAVGVAVTGSCGNHKRCPTNSVALRRQFASLISSAVEPVVSASV